MSILLKGESIVSVNEKKALRFLYIVKRVVFYSDKGTFNVDRRRFSVSYERKIGRVIFIVHYGYSGKTVVASILAQARVVQSTRNF
jgi:hypothetical protein